MAGAELARSATEQPHVDMDHKHRIALQMALNESADPANEIWGPDSVVHSTATQSEEEDYDYDFMFDVRRALRNPT